MISIQIVFNLQNLIKDKVFIKYLNLIQKNNNNNKLTMKIRLQNYCKINLILNKIYILNQIIQLKNVLKELKIYQIIYNNSNNSRFKFKYRPLDNNSYINNSNFYSSKIFK